jgi:Zn-dependent oligopeptidase
VYAIDLFYNKFVDTITDSKVGQEYVRCVLEKGGSQDPMQSLINFLGRKPSAKAFDERLLSITLEEGEDNNKSNAK